MHLKRKCYNLGGLGGEKKKGGVSICSTYTDVLRLKSEPRARVRATPAQFPLHRWVLGLGLSSGLLEVLVLSLQTDCAV